ncbi:MAG: hypothetical protein HY762_07010 [Planctomycetes bacterium]|nr:hypothetical protein [Planctomycetota bacterium]
MPTVQELVETVKGLKDEEKSQLLLEAIGHSSVLWLKDFGARPRLRRRTRKRPPLT